MLAEKNDFFFLSYKFSSTKAGLVPNHGMHAFQVTLVVQ